MRFDVYSVGTYIYGYDAASLYNFGAGRICNKDPYCTYI